MVLGHNNNIRVKKAEKKQPKRIVVSLQTTMRQLTQLDQAYELSSSANDVRHCLT
jgi:hypothetical protein